MKPTYRLERKVNKKWIFVSIVDSKNFPYCSKYERIASSF